MKVYILEYIQDPWYDCWLDSIIIWVYSTIELAQEKQKKDWKKENENNWYSISEVVLDE